MSFSLNECYDKMNVGEVILSYRGSVTADLITNVLGLVEMKLEDSDEKPNIKKRVYNVLVESLQNLFHHVDEPDENLKEYGDNFGIFVISHSSDGYIISTGNFMKNSGSSSLEERIEKINSMSKEELKDFYKFVLNNQKFSDKGGGGLGLIDIAKRTGRKLDYSFYEFDKTYDFFNLNVFIARN